MKPIVLYIILLIILSSVFLIFSLHSFHLIGSETHPKLRNTLKVREKFNQQQEGQESRPAVLRDLHRPSRGKNTTLDGNNIFSFCPRNSTHFSLQREILTDRMRRQMNYLTGKINDNTKRKSRKFPPKYSTREGIEECLSEEATPECAMWNCFPMSEDEFEKPSEPPLTSPSSSSSSSSSLSSTYSSPLSKTVLRASPTATLKKCCYEHKALRDTALWVIQKLEENNIRYFLSTGTALGSIRHRGVIIPWDTDVDMAIFPRDAAKVRELFSGLKHEHYFHKDPNGKPMFWIHHSKNGKPADGPHVEIFYEADYTNHEDDLLPLQRCDFYGTKNAWCPKTEMFEIWFGGKNAWQSYSGEHYHNDNRCTDYYLGQKIEKKNCVRDKK